MRGPPQADPRIGSEIAGYRIERLLGRGGMSVVYLAEQVRLKRPAALKLLAPELAGDERFRDRFLRESELAASLDHPNVIPIYDAGEIDGVLYIAMRYVEGSDLRELLKAEGKLEPERALAILGPVADALDYAHAHGLVHRDVKPGNILLATDGPVYLSDFGLTRRIDEGASLTEAGELVGSIDYAAPEQIDGRAVDGRTDVYALACVTYECLTGAVPFPRDSPMAKLWAHLRDTPLPTAAINPELPDELDPVLQRGLRKNPDDRYQTATELTGDLQAALAPPSPMTTRKAGRRMILVGTLAALAAIAALTVALVIALGGDSTAPDPILPLAGDSVVHIDADSGELTGAVSVEDPGAIAAGLGSVWVIDEADIALVEIDPRTGRRIRTLHLDDSFTAGRINIATDEGSVWLAHSPPEHVAVAGGSLSTMEPETGRIARFEPSINPSYIATSNGAVWVANGLRPIELLRVLPGSLDVARTASLPALDWVNFFEAGEAGLWLQTGYTTAGSPSVDVQQAWRVDPSTGAVLAQLDVGFWPTGFAVGPNSLWAVDASADEVVELDPATGAVLSRVRVGRSPSAVAVRGDKAWVANERDGTVSRIDTKTLDVLTIDVGGQPGSLAVTPDGVWVIVSA